jgi:hypothetical protein
MDQDEEVKAIEEGRLENEDDFDDSDFDESDDEMGE